MTPDEILADMQAQMTTGSRPRNFAGGLLPTFCRFLLELEGGHPSQGYVSWVDFLSHHPLEEGANQLSVHVEGGKTLGIRPHYNRIAHFYVVENERPDFPSAAPHATGQWRDYIPWLESLVTFTPDQLEDLDARARDFVLSHLPKATFDPAEVSTEPRLLELLIEEFPWHERATGEKTGAAFQALVFAYLRANSPHLQVENRKVRTGSARAGGVGDIDAWEGRRLISTAEVKHFKFVEKDVDEIAQFIRKAKARRAHAMVVALEFDQGAVDRLLAEGVRPVTMEGMLTEVQNWDPRKQAAAVLSFEYSIARIEKSTGLVARFDAFIDEVMQRNIDSAIS